MSKATNHNRKKAARNMERWRQRRREAAVRRLVAMGAEFIKTRLSEPSWLAEIFPRPGIELRLGDSVLVVDSVRREDDGVYAVRGILNKPIDFISITLGIDPATEPDKTLGVVSRFSPTGRSIESIHELPRRDFHIPGKTTGEALLGDVDYSGLEARCAAELYGARSSGFVEGRLSSGFPNFDNIPKPKEGE